MEPQRVEAVVLEGPIDTNAGEVEIEIAPSRRRSQETLQWPTSETALSLACRT